MIAYFDTSAIVPLLVDEAGTRVAGELWDSAGRIVTARLALVEARAALAQATRLRRITAPQRRSAVRALDSLFGQVDLVDIDDDLVRDASELAEHQALRAYDAVHLAAARRIADGDLVMVAGDRALLDAASAVGLAVAAIG